MPPKVKKECLCVQNKIDSKFTRSSNSRNTRVGNGAEGVLLEVKRVKDMMKKKKINKSVLKYI